MDASFRQAHQGTSGDNPIGSHIVRIRTVSEEVYLEVTDDDRYLLWFLEDE